VGHICPAGHERVNSHYFVFGHKISKTHLEKGERWEKTTYLRTLSCVLFSIFCYDTMRGMYSKQRRKRNVWKFWFGNLHRINDLEDLSVSGTIILK